MVVVVMAIRMYRNFGQMDISVARAPKSSARASPLTSLESCSQTLTARSYSTEPRRPCKPTGATLQPRVPPIL